MIEIKTTMMAPEMIRNVGLNFRCEGGGGVEGWSRTGSGKSRRLRRGVGAVVSGIGELGEVTISGSGGSGVGSGVGGVGNSYVGDWGRKVTNFFTAEMRLSAVGGGEF